MAPSGLHHSGQFLIKIQQEPFLRSQTMSLSALAELTGWKETAVIHFSW